MLYTLAELCISVVTTSLIVGTISIVVVTLVVVLVVKKCLHRTSSKPVLGQINREKDDAYVTVDTGQSVSEVEYEIVNIKQFNAAQDITDSSV